MNILFVCTGNTCRSPIAEHIFRNLAEQEGIKVNVKSAGVSAMDGMNISQHAGQILREKKIEVSHSSQSLTESLLDWADLILTMTQNHKQMMISQFPQSVKKVYILKEYVDDVDEDKWQNKMDRPAEEELEEIKKLEKEKPHYDISDPFGGDIEVYKKSAEEIEEALKKLKNKLE